MKEHSTEEAWKPIPGYDGWYDVSDQGRVRSWRLPGTDMSRSQKPRILTNHPDKDGYHKIGLFREGRRAMHYVHRLVLETFRGPIPAGLETRHLNGIAADNRLENLGVGTRMENIADKELHGSIARGERHLRAKISRADALEIKRLYATGAYTMKGLGKQFGLVRQSVGKIIHGVTWAHLQKGDGA